MNLFITAVYWVASTSYCVGFGDITAHVRSRKKKKKNEIYKFVQSQTK